MATTIQEETLAIYKNARKIQAFCGDTGHLGLAGFVQRDNYGSEWSNRRYSLVYRDRLFNRFDMTRFFGIDQVNAYTNDRGVDVWVRPLDFRFDDPYAALHSSGYFRFQTSEGDMYEKHPDGRESTRVGGLRLIDKRSDGTYLAHAIVGRCEEEEKTQEDVDRLYPSSLFSSSFPLEKTVASYRELFGELFKQAA